MQELKELNLEQIEKDEFKINIGLLKQDVQTLLLQKLPKEATELIAKQILEENKIYTTRDDTNSEVWIYQQGIYKPQGRTFIKEYARTVLEVAFTTYLANQIIAKIEADTYIEQELFFKQDNKEEIIVENGILNLITRELTPFTPDKIFFTKIPIEYNSIAVCPNVETHFRTVLKSEEDSEVMFELFGYLLYKEYFIEKGIMLIGDGRNGKGKTLDLMKRFLGADNCSSIPLQDFERDQFSQGELFNKLANLSGDLDDSTLAKTGTFKTLTGRDLISAPRKFLTRVNFVNFAKLIFACNKLPSTKDTSPAFWNRWILFEFPFTFLSENEINELKENEKQKVKLRNPNIIEKLTSKEEMSGLLNKALDGLTRLRTNKDFSYSKGINEIKNLWIRKSDSFLAFCLDEIKEDFECRIEKKVLRLAYFNYCKKHKLRPVSDKAIRETLFENFAVSEEKTVDGRYWSGIAFKNGKLFEDLSGKMSVFG